MLAAEKNNELLGTDDFLARAFFFLSLYTTNLCTSLNVLYYVGSPSCLMKINGLIDCELKLSVSAQDILATEQFVYQANGVTNSACSCPYYG